MRNFSFRHLALLALLVVAHTGYGQAYFNRRYALTTGYSGAVTVLPIPAGGYWVAGGAGLTPSSSSQALTLQKIDAAGNVAGPLKIWAQAGTNYYSTLGNALLPLPDGGMMLIGNTASAITAGNLWRFNAQGDTLWKRAYRGVGLPRGGCRLVDGGYALVGEVTVANPSALNRRDVSLLRTDSLGRELWRQRYHNDYIDVAWHVLPTADGGFVLSGGTYPFTSGPTLEADGLLLKVDSAGTEQWRTTYGGSWFDVGGPVLATPDGGFVVGGASADTIDRFQNYSPRRPTLFWFDSAGTLLRTRAYGPARNAQGTFTLLPQPDGGYVLAGQTSDSVDFSTGATGNAEGFLLRVCADGDSVWYRTYKNLTGGNSDNYLRDVKQTADGGFVGAGFLHARPPDTGTPDTWLFKTDAYGYLQPGGRPPVVVCPVVGLGEVPPTDAAGLELWPNPAPDGRYRVRVAGAAGGAPATLEVRDGLGRLVWRGRAETPETALDLSAQAPGVYHLRVWPAGGGAPIMRQLVR